MLDFLIYFGVICWFLYYLSSLKSNKNRDTENPNRNKKGQIIDKKGNVLETNKQRDIDGNFIDKYREESTTPGESDNLETDIENNKLPNQEDKEEASKIKINNEKTFYKFNKKYTFLFLVVTLILGFFSINYYLENQRLQQLRLNNPEVYFTEEFLDDVEKLDSTETEEYCDNLINEYFVGSKGFLLRRYESYFLSVDKVCFSINSIKNNIVEYSKGEDGIYSYYYDEYKQPPKVIIELIIERTNNLTLQTDLNDLVNKQKNLEELQKNCISIRAKYESQILFSIRTIDKAADLVVFPDNYTSNEAIKFFDKSIEQLVSIKYEDISNLIIKDIIQSLSIISKTKVATGLRYWKDGFINYKKGFSSYSSDLTKGDRQLDPAIIELRSLLTEIQSLDCDQILDS